MRSFTGSEGTFASGGGHVAVTNPICSPSIGINPLSLNPSSTAWRARNRDSACSLYGPASSITASKRTGRAILGNALTSWSSNAVQRADVVQFGAGFFGLRVALLIQQRLLLLSYTYRVLPQARVHILRSNHRSRSFRSEPTDVRSRVAYTWRSRRRGLPTAATAYPKVNQTLVCCYLPWSLPAFPSSAGSLSSQPPSARNVPVRSQHPTRARGRRSPPAGNNAFTELSLIARSSI